jgi:hypothetical protein
MTCHLITAAILLAAGTLYGFGFSGLGVTTFVAGAAFELWFWFRLTSSRTATRANRIIE